MEGGHETYVNYGRPPLPSGVCLHKKKTPSSSSSSYGRWSELPVDIMAMILRILDSTDDHLNFSKVCKSWRYGASRAPIRLQIPLVLLPSDTRRRAKARWISLLDMSTGKIHEFNLPKPIHGGTCYGCSKGWILMGKRSWESIKPRLFLFNPISGSYVKLPSIPITIHLFHSSSLSFLIEGFQLSSAAMSLSSTNSTVAIICHGVIAICRPHSPKTKRWITLQKGWWDYADIFFSGD
ncbi:hypothetical protein HS088_TW05G00314 [Tripterygium wilfordii]|uniref:F-box domain-containing protein n=1 Tax=Tripterygium wilfordii TaxID=458696 RepID=A0A7J7DMS8_TRIWF|nr:hypothetical protein HS088_TW05G00314 [Tripterygium wilfordii]